MAAAKTKGKTGRVPTGTQDPVQPPLAHDAPVAVLTKVGYVQPTDKPKTGTFTITEGEELHFNLAEGSVPKGFVDYSILKESMDAAAAQFGPPPHDSIAWDTSGQWYCEEPNCAKKSNQVPLHVGYDEHPYCLRCANHCKHNAEAWAAGPPKVNLKKKPKPYAPHGTLRFAYSYNCVNNCGKSGDILVHRPTYAYCGKCSDCCEHNIAQHKADALPYELLDYSNPKLKWAHRVSEEACRFCSKSVSSAYHNAIGCYKCERCCGHNWKKKPTKKPHPALQWEKFWQAKQTCSNCDTNAYGVHNNCYKCEECCPHNEAMQGLSCAAHGKTECKKGCKQCNGCSAYGPACLTCLTCADNCCKCVTCKTCDTLVMGNKMCPDSNDCYNCCDDHTHGDSEKGWTKVPPWMRRGDKPKVVSVAIDFDQFKKIDPVQEMASFYLLSYMAMGIATTGHCAGPANALGGEPDGLDCDVWTAEYLKAKLVDRCAPVMALCIDFSIGGELRYHQALARAYGGNKYSVSRPAAWSKWLSIRRQLGAIVLKDAAKLFRELRNGSIGGEKWATAAEVLYMFETGAIPPWLFVDRVFTMQHNGGSILNKVTWGDKAACNCGTSNTAHLQRAVNVGNAHCGREPDLAFLYLMADRETQVLFQSWWKNRNKVMSSLGLGTVLFPDWRPNVVRSTYRGPSYPIPGYDNMALKASLFGGAVEKPAYSEYYEEDDEEEEDYDDGECHDPYCSECNPDEEEEDEMSEAA